MKNLNIKNLVAIAIPMILVAGSGYSIALPGGHVKPQIQFCSVSTLEDLQARYEQARAIYTNMQVSYVLECEGQHPAPQAYCDSLRSNLEAAKAAMLAIFEQIVACNRSTSTVDTKSSTLSESTVSDFVEQQ